MPDSSSHHCPEAWELETWGMRMVEQRKPRQDWPHLEGEMPRVVRNPHWQRPSYHGEERSLLTRNVSADVDMITARLPVADAGFKVR